MNKNERIWFEHILDSSQKVIKFSNNKTVDDLKSDDMLYYAILKCVEIIGEASTKITPETRSQYDDIPWKDIIAMRNRLVHGYFSVDYQILWNVVVKKIPELITSISKILIN